MTVGYPRPPMPGKDSRRDFNILRSNALKQPDSASAWRILGRALRGRSDRAAAAAAFARSIAASLADPAFADVERLLHVGQSAKASQLLAERLDRDPDDLVAMRMAGDIAGRDGQPVEAERHYRRCIDLCPSYLSARHGLVRLLMRQARLAEASNESERMLAAAPTDPSVRIVKASVAASVGDHDDAAALYLGLVHEQTDRPGAWLGLGHSHRTMGRRDAAIAAYRQATTMSASAAEAYWGLANLKTYGFSTDEVARMSERVNVATGQDAAHLHFALGQAFQAIGDKDRAYDHFPRGNAAKRETIIYDADRAEHRQACWTASVTADLLTAHSDEGDPSTAPIFIVGLPRSGSTLVEQILGSHPLIESTAELPYMNRVATMLARRGMAPGHERATLDVDGIDLEALGRGYLSAARVHRKTDKPYFVNKLPGNFAHSGLIKLILPNARIVDVRRHPMASTWAVFKQLFAHGQPYAYDLTEIARWYRSYVTTMDRFDAVMPGAIHRVRNEHLVYDTDAENTEIAGSHRCRVRSGVPVVSR